MSEVRVAILGVISCACLFFFGSSCMAESSTLEEQMNTNTQAVRVRMLFGDHEAVVSLVDNPSSRDFLSLLPLTMTFEDFNHIEKISVLPRKLQTAGAPSSCDPDVGTFAYYVPWGNLSIFYRDFRHSSGLVPLGHVEWGMEALAAQHGDFEARLELLH